MPDLIFISKDEKKADGFKAMRAGLYLYHVTTL